MPRIVLVLAVVAAFLLGLGADLLVRTSGEPSMSPVRLGVTVLDQQLISATAAAGTATDRTLPAQRRTDRTLDPPTAYLRVRVDNRGTGPVRVMSVRLDNGPTLAADAGPGEARLAAGAELTLTLTGPLGCTDTGAGVSVPAELLVDVDLQDEDGTPATAVVTADRAGRFPPLTSGVLDAACGIVPAGAELSVQTVGADEATSDGYAYDVELHNASRQPQRLDGLRVAGATGVLLEKNGVAVRLPLEVPAFAVLSDLRLRVRCTAPLTADTPRLVLLTDRGVGQLASNLLPPVEGPCAPTR